MFKSLMLLLVFCSLSLASEFDTLSHKVLSDIQFSGNQILIKWEDGSMRYLKGKFEQTSPLEKGQAYYLLHREFEYWDGSGLSYLQYYFLELTFDKPKGK
jgi:hypothetical protein